MPHCLSRYHRSGQERRHQRDFLSLLYKADARDVRLISSTPKMLEMSVYEAIPHLLAPVVTDMKQAANALSWCVVEMDRRYRLMSSSACATGRLQQKIADATEAGNTLPNRSA